MKTHDTLGRRNKFLIQPKGKQVSTTERDLLWYHAIHRHGPLPVAFLHEFSKHIRKGYNAAQDRATDLTNDAQTLTRMYRSKRELGVAFVYNLNDKSRIILEEYDLWSELAPRLHPPFEHMLMVSSITASIEIQAKEKGIGFKSQQELITKPLEFPYEKSKLIPDGLCALVRNEKQLALFIEADRSSEPNTSSKYRSSLDRKVEQYTDLFATKRYRDIGLDSDAMLLFITTTEAKRRAMLSIIEKKFPKGYARIGVHVLTDFGTDFTIPKPFNMLDVPFSRCGYPAMVLST
jgi:hypothetical protein